VGTVLKWGSGEMLEDEDLEEIERLIQHRRRHLERIEGINQQFTHTSQAAKVKELFVLVANAEERLREYGIMIDTVGSTN
jgi:hypothetical protein